MRAIRELIIHHTASRMDDVESITAAHERNGWATIAYHNVIGGDNPLPDGHIAAGRDHRIAGAGVKRANSGKLQVVLVGNFELGHEGYTGRPTAKQIDALGWWLIVNGNRYGMTDYRKVLGHHEAALPQYATLCPGNQMPLRLIRLWFRDNIGKFESREFESLLAYLRRQGWEPE